MRFKYLKDIHKFYSLNARNKGAINSDNNSINGGKRWVGI